MFLLLELPRPLERQTSDSPDFPGISALVYHIFKICPPESSVIRNSKFGSKQRKSLKPLQFQAFSVGLGERI